MDRDLYPFRRHLRTCSYFGPGGRDVRLDKCNCPFHADGSHNGFRVRQSLKTRSRQVAERRVADIIKTLDRQAAQEKTNSAAPGSARTSAQRTVKEAVERFLRSHGQVFQDGKYQGDLEYGTWRKYRSSLGLFSEFCETERVSLLVNVTMETIEDYRATRQIALVTWRVELQALRTFFGFCVSHNWLTANPAKEIRGPRNVKPNDVVPYTLVEECQILAACDEIGGKPLSPNGCNV